MTFASFNLHPRIAAGIETFGFTEPTPIQQQSIPSILEGRDVMGLAQTGTGKTAAFVLPILERLLAGPRRRVRALVIAPTRELAEQTREAVAGFGRETGLRSTSLYGGVALAPQLRELRRGVEIVVACPGRLLDHLGQRTIDLSGVEIVVLDEADRMLDMGFLPDVRRILRQLPAGRQTLLFSATMPEEVRRLTREWLRDPVVVQIGHSAPAATVSHALYPVEPHRKTALLLALLEDAKTGSVLVFTRTRHRAKRLAQQLTRSGHHAASLQGGLSQSQRRFALEGFRSGKIRVLVATDIAARGIDVSHLSQVINYDAPDTVDAYTHRIGRTGRAERTGEAFTLMTREDAATVGAIERTLGKRIERRRLEGFDPGEPAPRSAPTPLTRRPPARYVPKGSPRRRRRAV